VIRPYLTLPSSKLKQTERLNRISALPSSYCGPISQQDNQILKTSITHLVSDVKAGATAPIDILHAYGKVALKAHERTNCLTEVLIKEAEEYLERGEINLKGPLAGVPVSLKDTIEVGGFDTTVGYSKYVGVPAEEDGVMVKLLKELGKCSSHDWSI
jgi:Asp-tRNA(Asn)/Glu-tRNA(Gln) amidotransferase A subunit family amidase